MGLETRGDQRAVSSARACTTVAASHSSSPSVDSRAVGRGGREGSNGLGPGSGESRGRGSHRRHVEAQCRGRGESRANTDRELAGGPTAGDRFDRENDSEQERGRELQSSFEKRVEDKETECERREAALELFISAPTLRAPLNSRRRRRRKQIGYRGRDERKAIEGVRWRWLQGTRREGVGPRPESFSDARPARRRSCRCLP